MLTRTAHRTLTDQLAERFAERIRARLLPAGARLPSVRECARQQGVSPYTRVLCARFRAKSAISPCRTSADRYRKRSSRWVGNAGTRGRAPPGRTH